jgi:hypothetical protein
MPQPTAGPFTAAIKGTSLSSSALAAGVSAGFSARRSAARPSPPPITCLTSSPEQKALPAPVTTRQRAVVSRTARSSAA